MLHDRSAMTREATLGTGGLAICTGAGPGVMPAAKAPETRHPFVPRAA